MQALCGQPLRSSSAAWPDLASPPTPRACASLPHTDRTSAGARPADHHARASAAARRRHHQPHAAAGCRACGRHCQHGWAVVCCLHSEEGARGGQPWAWLVFLLVPRAGVPETTLPHPPTSPRAVGFPLVGGPAGTMEGGRQSEIAKAILGSKNVPYVVAAPLLIQVRAELWTSWAVLQPQCQGCRGQRQTVPWGGRQARLGCTCAKLPHPRRTHTHAAGHGVLGAGRRGRPAKRGALLAARAGRSHRHRCVMVGGWLSGIALLVVLQGQ